LGMVRASEHQLRSVIANREAGLVTGPPAELDAVSTKELRELADLLSDTAAREEAAKPVGPPAQLAEEPPPPKDDYAYMPREPLLGLFQSTLEAHATSELPVEETPMLDDRRA